jgi:hypothetical protein
MGSSPLRCTSSRLSLSPIIAISLVTNPPVVAVTFQCTTLAAMKRKSDTLCHAQIPGLLRSPLQCNAAPGKKKEKKNYDETFALVTGTGFVLPLAVNWANRLDLEERP